MITNIDAEKLPEHVEELHKDLMIILQKHSLTLDPAVFSWLTFELSCCVILRHARSLAEAKCFFDSCFSRCSSAYAKFEGESLDEKSG